MLAGVAVIAALGVFGGAGVDNIVVVEQQTDEGAGEACITSRQINELIRAGLRDALPTALRAQAEATTADIVGGVIVAKEINTSERPKAVSAG